MQMVPGNTFKEVDKLNALQKISETLFTYIYS